MRVDVAPLRHFLIAAGVSVVVIVIAIIVGATGPKEFDSVTFYAYNCPDRSHEWSPSCTGVQLANNESWWQGDIPPVTSLNRFWALQFTPYTPQKGHFERKLHAEVFLWGRDSPHAGVPWSLLYTRNTTEDVECEGSECSDVTLIYEPELRYPYYLVRLRFLDGGAGFPPDPAAGPFLGDVQFTVWFGHTGYSSLELALRIVYLFTASVLLIAFLWHLRGVALEDWAWEQRALVLLLLGVLALNNPFFGLQYVAKGWFFHFLDAFLNIIFLSIFLVFGLLILDKIRLEEVRMPIGRQHIPKFVMVGIFAILGVVLFSWVDIKSDNDPIQGHPEAIDGIEVLFYIEATVYAGILIWLAVLVVMTIPIATTKPYLMTRFLFASIPTSFCIIAILIGIFNGTFGPLNESTLSMVFFLTLYNEYIWILTYGFWPVKERFLPRNPSEADSIIRFDDQH